MSIKSAFISLLVNIMVESDVKSTQKILMSSRGYNEAEVADSGRILGTLPHLPIIKCRQKLFNGKDRSSIQKVVWRKFERFKVRRRIGIDLSETSEIVAFIVSYCFTRSIYFSNSLRNIFLLQCSYFLSI